MIFIHLKISLNFAIFNHYDLVYYFFIIFLSNQITTFIDKP